MLRVFRGSSKPCRSNWLPTFGKRAGFLCRDTKVIDGTRKVLYKLAAIGEGSGYLCSRAGKVQLVRLGHDYNQMVGAEGSMRVFTTMDEAMKDEVALQLQKLSGPFALLQAGW